MGKAICKMFLTMELSVKSFINSSLARHCAIGACLSSAWLLAKTY